MICDYDAMGWLRLVGSLILQVSFAKETYKKDDILQKTTWHLVCHVIMMSHHDDLENEMSVSDIKHMAYATSS